MMHCSILECKGRAKMLKKVGGGLTKTRERSVFFNKNPENVEKEANRNYKPPNKSTYYKSLYQISVLKNLYLRITLLH